MAWRKTKNLATGSRVINHLLVRTQLGEALKDQLPPKGPLPDKLAELLRELDEADRSRSGSPEENKGQSWRMLLRARDTGLCALKLTLHHAVGEGHEIEFARRRKLDDRPNDLLSAFVIIRREPKYKGGGGKCLIHNFYELPEHT
jgi:hypothetical protein